MCVGAGGCVSVCAGVWVCARARAGVCVCMCVCVCVCEDDPFNPKRLWTSVVRERERERGREKEREEERGGVCMKVGKSI